MSANMHEPVELYDTTLRDGTQMRGISLSVDDKLRIAQRLDSLGIPLIEGGWPGSNPKDEEFFIRAKDYAWKHATIASFGSTRRVGVVPEDDANLQALLASKTAVCTVVGKSSPMHVTEVLRAKLDENLRLIEDSVGYLRSQGRRVIYDAEHFFDGAKADRAYALETLRAAIRGGAETIVLCDTNGGSLPWEIEEIVRAVTAIADKVKIGIHTHNDGESAVANSLAAIRTGARHIQGTINGYGERCGNANLCSVIANLELKLKHPCLPKGHLEQLSEVSRFVAEVANIVPSDQAAFVGANAFAHKGGIHVAAMRRTSESYQHIDPAVVGNKMSVVVSELSGRGNLLSKAEELGVSVDDDTAVTAVLKAVKDLEARGFSFEAAEASVALMLKRLSPDYRPPFELVDYFVLVEHRQGRGKLAEAVVKVRVGGEVVHTVAEGDGPIHALDAALRKALASAFPTVERFKLVDYKVRILDGQNGTKAVTRVLIDTRDAETTWSTVGASHDIIEASWQALADAVEFGLIRRSKVVAARVTA